MPLFQRYGAEDQLTAMYDPEVQLKSGGYLVINPTEALVSIDINSGRSTKEHGIEATAVSTNLEAAREIARQLRLRDMAGLVVIDFIDMEYGSNVRKVEKAMKDALRNDRARIQVGRISSFGLMEMSRQRLRTGVLEATTRGCPHCDGTGLVRTASSAGLSALRLIEEEAAKGKGSVISLYASTEAAVYLLNAKRADLHEIEERYGVAVQVLPEGENEGAKMRVASAGPRPEFAPKFEPIMIEPDDEEEIDDAYEDEDGEEEEVRRDRGRGDGERSEGDRAEGRGGKRRKRRRGRGRDREDGESSEAGEPARAANDDAADSADDDDSDEEGAGAPQSNEPGEDGEGPRKRRRRGRRRRGGRARGEGGEGESQTGENGDDEAAEAADVVEAVAAEPAPAKPRRSRRKAADVTAEAEAEAPAAIEAEVAPPTEAASEEAPAKPKRSRRKKADEVEAIAEMPTAPVAEEPIAPAVEDEAPARPKRSRAKKAAPQAQAMQAGEAETADAGAGAEEDGPRRSGWWQRTFGN